MSHFHQCQFYCIFFRFFCYFLYLCTNYTISTYKFSTSSKTSLHIQMSCPAMSLGLNQLNNSILCLPVEFSAFDNLIHHMSQFTSKSVQTVWQLKVRTIIKVELIVILHPTFFVVGSPDLLYHNFCIWLDCSAAISKEYFLFHVICVDFPVAVL